MHRCLHIVEVLEMIFREFDGRKGRATLARLARTCRTFSPGALDLLWKAPGSLDPILGLFPADLVALRPTEGRKLQWEILRPIAFNDWDRVAVYAPRVKSFYLGFSTLEKTSKVLPVLSFCSPRGLVFPNLRYLGCTFVTINPALIRPLLPAGLEEFSLLCQADTESLSIISVLGDLCPGLKTVTIHLANSESNDPKPSLSNLLHTLRRLVSLTIDMPDAADIAHLGQLSTLKTLQLGTLPHGLSSLPVPSYPLFPNLVELRISHAEIQSAIAFLAFCANTPLASLRLNFASTSSDADVARFYHALKLACAHDSLRVLRIVHSAEVMARKSLRILASFEQLRELAISAASFEFDDQTIGNLATSWPFLQKLNLMVCTLDILVDPPITLHAFRLLVRHCPMLHFLRLDVDASQVPPAEPTRIGPHSLEHLDVGCSRILHAPSVARYLSGLFPKLESITTDREYEDNDDPDEIAANEVAIERHRLWKQVESEVPEFVAAREEEHPRDPL
ncbi:hypothetical protein R3P38DRAFT_3200476 [Favolaschia claudopus]|uniref:F-box protein n=1 Tax=Favolaschia claudopus TaxID=2862362 RepID=A0AAW0AXQ3_9AGAR